MIRGILLLLGLGLAGCSGELLRVGVFPRLGHRPGAIDRAPTRYSGADGRIALMVDSSSGAADLGRVFVALEHADLRYIVWYEVAGWSLPIEPGHYRLAAIDSADCRATLATPELHVRSGNTVVLPTMWVERDGARGQIRFDADSADARRRLALRGDPAVERGGRVLPAWSPGQVRTSWACLPAPPAWDGGFMGRSSGVDRPWTPRSPEPSRSPR